MSSNENKVQIIESVSVTEASGVADAVKNYEKIASLIGKAIKIYQKAEKSYDKFAKSTRGEKNFYSSRGELMKNLDAAVKLVNEAYDIYEDMRDLGEFVRNKYVRGPLEDCTYFYESAMEAIEAIEDDRDHEGEDAWESLKGKVYEPANQLEYAVQSAEETAKDLKEREAEHNEAAKSYDELAKLAESAHKSMEELSNIANKHEFDDILEDASQIVNGLEDLIEEIAYRKSKGSGE